MVDIITAMKYFGADLKKLYLLRAVARTHNNKITHPAAETAGHEVA